MRISLSNLKRPGTSAALFLILLCLFTLGLRLRNLDRLSLWMDEGFYVLAAEEILEHGYPLYPSGHILYKGILYGYLLSLVSLIFGFSASSLRAFSVLTSVAVIPLFYLFAKKFAGRAAALAGCVLLAFSAWETEYARTVIYFAPLQLIYLAGLYFFYRGFFENRKKDKIAAAIVFFLAPHIHQLAMGVFFCFAALFLIKGARRFFRKDVLIPIGIVGLSYLAIQVHEIFFWKVGYVYEKAPASLAEALAYFFQSFSLVYFREILRSFPSMGLILFFGVLILLAEYLIRRQKPEAVPAVKDDSLAGWTYLNLSLIFPLLFFGFFRTHVQPRYLFQLLPLFILLFLVALGRISLALGRLALAPFSSKGASKTGLRIASAAFFIIGIFLFSDQIGWRTTMSIINRDYKDPIRTDVIARSGRTEHHDHRGPGEYVRRYRREGDLVIAMHMVFQYIYGGPTDDWLWSGGPGTWDAWEQTPEGWKDVYVGARWINSLEGLRKVIEENGNRRVWLVTSPSIDRWDHIHREIASFIRSQADKLVFRGRDATSEVYLFNDPEGRLASGSRTLEAEWIPASFGRIEYDPEASKGSVLHLSGKTAAVRTVSFSLPGTFAPGSYRLALRIKVDERREQDRILGVAVSPGPRAKDIHSRFYGSRELRRNGMYGTVEDSLVVPRQTGLRIKIIYSGDGELWLDYLDLISTEEKTFE